MNIAIITLPLHVNYGGILQAYALQRVLTLCGHNVITLDIPSKSKAPLSIYRQIRAFCGTSLNVLLGRDRFENIYWPFNKNIRNLHVVRMSMRPFINKIMRLSPPISSEQELREYVENNNIEALVVGSDQVWRPKYNSNIEYSFISFLEPSSNVLRIAVSASFGTSDWEFSREQTDKFSKLAQHFKAISVREFSGVDLCQKYLKVESRQTIDPTLLLTPKEYNDIIELGIKETISVKNKIFVYIIDDTKQKKSICNSVASYLGKKLYELNPNERPKPYASEKSAINSAPKPLAQWLRAIKDTDFVLTDSFHGTVFSILYHKPFIIISNQSRGQARIETLLKIFGLEERLLNPVAESVGEDFKTLIEKPIEWSMVDSILEEKRKELQDFLKSSLDPLP